MENENANFWYGLYFVTEKTKPRTKNIKALLVFAYVINEK